MELPEFQLFLKLNFDVLRNIIYLTIDEQLSLGSILKAISPFEPIYNELRREKIKAYKKEGRDVDIEIFRSKRLWQYILKRLGKVIMRFSVPVPLYHEEDFFIIPKVPHNNISSYFGLFVFRNFPDGKIGRLCISWNKYIINVLKRCFINEKGEHFNVTFEKWDFSSNYFVGVKEGILSIYTDTPWNRDFLIFETELRYHTSDLDVLESLYGIYLCIKYAKNSVAILYSVDFENKKLKREMSRIENYKRLTSTCILKDGDFFDLIIREKKIINLSSKIPIDACMPSGIVGIDLFRNLKCEWFVYDSINNREIRHFNDAQLGYAPYVFDFILILDHEIIDLITGEILFSHQSSNNIMISRKSDHSGYFVWG